MSAIWSLSDVLNVCSAAKLFEPKLEKEIPKYVQGITLSPIYSILISSIVIFDNIKARNNTNTYNF